MEIHVVANAATGPSLSGGDRIFIECVRRWKQEHEVRVYVWEEGFEMCKRNHLDDVKYTIWRAKHFRRMGMGVLYLMRIVKGIVGALLARTGTKSNKVIIYSASDFFPDTLPAFFMKWKNRSAKWVACLFQVVPAPWKGYTKVFREGTIRPSPKLMIMYFLQFLTMMLMKWRADQILVLNDLDKARLIGRGIESDKIFITSGGVDTVFFANIMKDENIYDACFLGRFHPQKGINDLIEIWRQVCDNEAHARLAIIGDGDRDWSDRLRKEIRNVGLEKNVDLVGLVDQYTQFKVLKSSKLFLFPSTYEAWGIVACEAMACGVPVVAYNLPIFESIFPQGMVTVPIGDTKEFAEAVIHLLKSEGIRRELGEEALKMAHMYDWDTTARKLSDYFERLFSKRQG